MNRHAMTYMKRILLGLLLPLALSACGGEPPTPPPLEGARIGGPFTLTDKSGKEVHWSDFEGQYRIVYFGFTSCPDACPLDLGIMMKGFRSFEQAHPELGRKVQPIFITIDPERDTPKDVGDYAAAFHPRLLGLTGTPEQVAAAASAFAVPYAKVDDQAGDYDMDHGRFAFLMGPEGKPIALLPIDEAPPEHAVKSVTAELEKWVK